MNEWEVQSSAPLSEWDVVSSAPAPDASIGDMAKRALSTAWDVINTNPIKAAGGAGFADAYDFLKGGVKEAGEAIFKPAWTEAKSKLPWLRKVGDVAETAGDYVDALARKVPEMADSMLTPLGAATAVLPWTRAIPAPVKEQLGAAAGAAFSAPAAVEAAKAVPRTVQNPSPENVADVVGNTAMAALPFLNHPRGISKETKSGIEQAKAREVAEAKRIAEEAGKEADRMIAADREAKAKLATMEQPPAEPPAKSAEESANVFREEQGYVEPLPKGPLTPSAETVAARIQQAELPNREQRRESVMLPEDGPSDYMQRLQDYKERASQEVAQKPYSALEDGDRSVVDELALEAMQRRANQRGSISFKDREPRGNPQNPEIGDQYLNRDRIEVSPQEERLVMDMLRGKHERGEISTAREKWTSIDEAKQAGVDPALFQRIMAGEAPGGIQGRAALEIFRERANELGKEIVADTTRLEREAGQISESDAAALRAEIDRKTNDFQNYHGALTGVTTDLARSLAALRRVAGSTTDPVYWIGEAKRSMGLPPGSTLPEPVLVKIVKLTEKAKTDTTGTAQQELVNEIAALRENGWLETAVALWRAGLLTGVKTHLRNVGGNVMFGAMEEAARIPAWAADVARVGVGRMRGMDVERKVWAPSMEAAWKSGMAAATDGVREARQVLAGRTTPGDLAKGEVKHGWNFQGLRKLGAESDSALVSSVLGTSNDMVNRYINTVGRTLGAEDKIFKVYAIRRALEGEARLQAVNEARSLGKNDRWMRGRQLELAKNPTESMTANAMAYADFATFNNKNVLAQAVENFGAQGPIRKFVVDTTLPFRNTPFNIFNRMIDYSPLGPVATPLREFYTSKWQKKATPDMVKTFEEALGRGMIGSALMYLGYTWGKENMATGTQKEDPGKANVRKGAGRTPGSVRFPFAPDVWAKTAAFAPGMTLVQIGADYARQEERSERKDKTTPGDQVLDVAGVAKRAALEQPMLQGVKDLNDALYSDSERRSRTFVSSKAGSLVPQIIADVATTIDPTPKEFAPGKNASLTESAAHGIRARLPFLKAQEPDVMDIFGETPEGRRGNAVNPFMPSTAKELTDPIYQELLLNDISITHPKQLEGEDDNEYRARKRAAGQILRRNLESAMDALPEDPEERKKAIEKIVRDSRREALNEWKDNV